jgi:fatty-acyl-CoA synthase
MTIDPIRFRTITEALEAAPADRWFVTAWIEDDEQEEVTFGEFRRRARLAAGLLASHGVQCGDRAVIIMPQSIAAMTGFAGAMMLGAVPAFLAYPNFKIEPSKYRSGLAGVTANLSAKVVVIDEEFPDDLLAYVAVNDGTQLVRVGNSLEAAESVDLDVAIGAEDIAFIQHSAGTTGLQKGVALTHHAVLTQLRHLADALNIDSNTDLVYSWLPLYHDMGLIACFMLPLVCHLPIVMQSPLDWVIHPETMLHAITQHKCTLAWMPNFGFQFLPRRIRPEHLAGVDLSSLRALINCSEPVREKSMREFTGAFAPLGLRGNVLQSSYAMAEDVFAVTQSRLDSPDGPTCIWADGARFRGGHVISIVPEGTPGAVSFVSSGEPLPNHQLRIALDDGTIVGESVVGEILIASECLFSGYYNRQDLTVKVLLDGWYHTGDLGFCLANELFVVGRMKDLLIIGGENLYPQDIEEVVSLHPNIHDGRVVALGIYNPDLGTEEIVVAAEVESDKPLADSGGTEAEIRARIVASLGIAVRTIILKPPKWIVKSTAGKPARSATRDKLLLEHPELNYEHQEV